jgi:hypothetical protein
MHTGTSSRPLSPEKMFEFIFETRFTLKYPYK